MSKEHDVINANMHADGVEGHAPNGDGNHAPQQPSEMLNEHGLRFTYTMSDRELLEEIVLSMRTVGVALAAMQKMGPAGMMKAALTGKLDLKPPTQ